MADDNKPQDDSNVKRLFDETQPGVSAGEPGDGLDKAAANGPNDKAADKAGEKKADDLAEQLAKSRNDFLYLYAEFENYKKNAIKERSDLRKYGSERLVVDLLNVLDIFETALALENTPENMPAFRKGIEMTATELRSALHRNGIEEIPALGTPFNPMHHEALSSEETADLEPGHVSRVFKKPYKLHERVVRPGQVVVAKAKS